MNDHNFIHAWWNLRIKDKLYIETSSSFRGSQCCIRRSNFGTCTLSIASFVERSIIIMLVSHNVSVSTVYLFSTETQAIYTDCKRALEHGQTSSGIFTVNPDNQEPFKVSSNKILVQIYMHHCSSMYMGACACIKSFIINLSGLL